MSQAAPIADAVAQIHLLGTQPLDDVLALQQRLVYEASGRNERLATLLLCEHPSEITIGRQGSRCDVRWSDETLDREQVRVRWLNRGGGTLLHSRGQLAVYVVLPLESFHFSVGEYLRRFQTGLEAVADDLHLVRTPHPGRRGIWSRNGQVMFLASAVRSWVSYFGAYLNVDPAERHLHAVAGDTIDGAEASSLAAVLRRPVRMPAVRQSVVTHLSTALGCERYHLFTGHPLLTRTLISPRNGLPPKDSARAG
ncbi:MAG: hypothetical protein JNL96_02290 [Planctomycetaceae bacterium]|nr:hypothetical protein [Planctomycetaceae bacterium]